MKIRFCLFVTASLLMTGSLAYASAPVANPASPQCAASPAAAPLPFLETSPAATLKAATFCGECSSSGCNTAVQVDAACGPNLFCRDTGNTCDVDGRVRCSCQA
jgi:hypothetical protein